MKKVWKKKNGIGYASFERYDFPAYWEEAGYIIRAAIAMVAIMVCLGCFAMIPLT